MSGGQSISTSRYSGTRPMARTAVVVVVAAVAAATAVAMGCRRRSFLRRTPTRPPTMRARYSRSEMMINKKMRTRYSEIIIKKKSVCWKTKKGDEK